MDDAFDLEYVKNDAQVWDSLKQVKLQDRSEPSKEEEMRAFEETKMQWENVQFLREQQRYGDDSHKVSDVNTRDTNISFDEVLKYYKGVNLEKEMELARERLESSRSNNGCFAGLVSCLGGSSTEYDDEKLFLICLTLIPLCHEIEEHDRQLFTIYKKITGDKHGCPSIGPHWEAIGFQGNDPKTDLRGVGMLGLLQLLFFIYSDESTTIQLFSLSQSQSFPLAVVSLNMTQLVLKMLLEGKLDSLIKKYSSVLDALNIAYSSVFYRFYLVWRRGQKKISDFDSVKKELAIEITKSLPTMIEEYTNMMLKRDNIATEKAELAEF